MFNQMFEFFYKIIKTDFLSFCGSDVEKDYKIIFDINAEDAKIAFKKYNNGDYTNIIKTKHPLLLLTIIKGKRGWGLSKDEYSSGISEGLFTKHEILQEFEIRNIKIPEPYLVELNNKIYGLKDSLENENNELIELDKQFKLELYKNTKDEVKGESKN